MPYVWSKRALPSGHEVLLQKPPAAPGEPRQACVLFGGKSVVATVKPDKYPSQKTDRIRPTPILLQIRDPALQKCPRWALENIISLWYVIEATYLTIYERYDYNNMKQHKMLSSNSIFFCCARRRLPGGFTSSTGQIHVGLDLFIQREDLPRSGAGAAVSPSAPLVPHRTPRRITDAFSLSSSSWAVMPAVASSIGC